MPKVRPTRKSRAPLHPPPPPSATTTPTTISTTSYDLGGGGGGGGGDGGGGVKRAQEHVSLLREVDSRISVDDRAWAINSIARLIRSEDGVFEIINNVGTVKLLVLSLFDTNVNVQVASIGAIRNLIVMGESALKTVLDADIMTSLVAIVTRWKEFVLSTGEVKQEKMTFFIHSLNVLALVSESNEKVGKLLQPSLSSLFDIIQPNVGTARSRIAALLVLESLDPSLPTFDTLMSTHQELLKKYILSDSSPLRLRVCCLGIFQNALSLTQWPSILSLSLPLIDVVLSLNTLFIGNIVEGIPANVAAQAQVPEPLAPKLDDWQLGINAIVSLLELLSNFLTTDPDLFVGGGDATKQIGVSETVEPGKLNPSIISLFLKNNLLMKVVALCSVDDVVGSLSQIAFLADYLPSFPRIQSRALSCLSNILLSFPVSALGDLQGLSLNLYQITQKAIDNDVRESSLRAIQSLWRSEASLTPELSHIEFIATLASNEVPEIRCCVINILAQMGKTPVGYKAMEDIAPIIATATFLDQSPFVIVEGVNAIFELFDDHHDQIVANLQILERLQQLAPSLQNLLQQLKVQTPDHVELLDHLDECLVNIGGFLEYKQQQKQ